MITQLQLINIIIIIIKDKHFRVRWLEFVNSLMALRISRPIERPSDFLVLFSNYVIYIYFSYNLPSQT